MTNGSPVLRVRPTLGPLLSALTEAVSAADREDKRAKQEDRKPNPDVLRRPARLMEAVLEAAVGLVGEAQGFRPIVTPSPAASPEGGVGLAGALE